jgi:hypothetical protein
MARWWWSSPWRRPVRCWPTASEYWARTTLRSRGNLADTYRAAGRATDAIALQEQALAAFERVLGPDHPDTLALQSNLATAYVDAGRATEAIALHEQTLADWERVLGPDHPRAKVPQQPGTDDLENWLQQALVEGTRPLRRAIKTLAKPVIDGVPHGVSGRGLDACFQFLVQRLELGSDFLLGLAGDLPPDPLPVRARSRARSHPCAGSSRRPSRSRPRQTHGAGHLSRTWRKPKTLAPSLAPSDTSLEAEPLLTCAPTATRTRDLLLRRTLHS